MTDEHGPDTDPLHEDASHEEHAPAPAKSTGTWPDDHPPVDDFSDAATASEEAATASEEVSGEEAPPPASPSRSMLPLFAGIGGILLVGAMIYWQFGHSSPPAMMTPQTQAPKSAAVLPPSPNPSSKPAVAPLSSGKVEESDITALYKVPPEPASLPIPSPSLAKPLITSSTMPPAGPFVPAMAPGQVNPSVPLAPSASAVVSVPSSDARIDKLAASVSDLQKSVEATAQEVNKLTTIVAATQAMPPVPSQVSPALEDRLNKIEQNLKQIEYNETAKPAPAVAAPPEETEATSAVITKPVSHHKKPVKHKPPMHKKTVHQPASLTAQVPVETSSAWVIRAATPGEAWVAADAHTTELKHVQVGDSLSGIGTIRVIRQTPGGWEIEGATGTIR